MERRDELHRAGCSVAKQTILTSHPSGLRARVSVELASIDSVCLHHAECQGSPIKLRKDWDMGSPFLSRRGLGGVSAHGTPVLGRRSDVVAEGRMSQQCTPVMRRKGLMDSPASSPVPSRRVDDEGHDDYCVDSVISGWLKFRDNKRWKSRWGVVTKLSPAADCLHLQLYREPRDRYKKGQSKASLSLQHFLGFESGFTLDKESNTIAIICQDVTVVLALETRERLISWQVKVGGQLGNPRQYIVMVGGGGRKLPAGPARLHLQGGKFAITSGVPPRLLGLWELAHLRRYGVVEGRFCFEGGSHCGKGEGLHVLLTDQAHEITESFRLAAEGKCTPERRPISSRKSTGTTRTETRLSDFNMEMSADTDSVMYEETPDSLWSDDVTLERCHHCSIRAEDDDMASHFTPAWTMEGVQEFQPDSEYLTPQPVRRVPPRPPKPGHLNITNNPRSEVVVDNPKAGPYENYDIPKRVPHEVDKGEYYDTPKRIKEILAEDFFRVTKGAPDSLVLKKNCGCILKFGNKNKLEIAENNDFKSVECPCQRVTNWASNLIRLPYCRRNSDDNDAEANNQQTAIYATVDVSRKTSRQSVDKDVHVSPMEVIRNENASDGKEQTLDSNYENLDFAMSLEYYENAKDLLRKAGMTQSELDALSADFNIDTRGIKATACTECSHAQAHNTTKRNKSDEYLLMKPFADVKHATLGRQNAAGYAPMSPVAGWSHSLKYSTRSHNEIEKSLSIPSLDGHVILKASSPQTRSSSVDSGRLPEDFKEFDCSFTTSSSTDTSRNMPEEHRPTSDNAEPSECKETPNLRNRLIDRTQMKRTASAPCKTECNRDSSSSNDSGVSSCSLRRGGHEFAEFEAPPSSARRRCGVALPRVHLATPRKSKSSDLRDILATTPIRHKSSSAEAEVPVLAVKAIRGVLDSRSTSSGTSDMSDYIETLSLSSEHSSTETSSALNRVIRQSTSTLRPRSGTEYTDTHTYRDGYTHLM